MKSINEIAQELYGMPYLHLEHHKQCTAWSIWSNQYPASEPAKQHYQLTQAERSWFKHNSSTGSMDDHTV